METRTSVLDIALHVHITDEVPDMVPDDQVEAPSPATYTVLITADGDITTYEYASLEAAVKDFLIFAQASPTFSLTA